MFLFSPCHGVPTGGREGGGRDSKPSFFSVRVEVFVKVLMKVVMKIVQVGGGRGKGEGGGDGGGSGGSEDEGEDVVVQFLLWPRASVFADHHPTPPHATTISSYWMIPTPTPDAFSANMPRVSSP